jgi:hypothetical protein
MRTRTGKGWTDEEEAAFCRNHGGRDGPVTCDPALPAVPEQS